MITATRSYPASCRAACMNPAIAELLAMQQPDAGRVDQLPSPAQARQP